MAAINMKMKYLKNHAVQCNQLLSPINFMNSYRRTNWNVNVFLTLSIEESSLKGNKNSRRFLPSQAKQRHGNLSLRKLWRWPSSAFPSPRLCPCKCLALSRWSWTWSKTAVTSEWLLKTKIDFKPKAGSRISFSRKMTNGSGFRTSNIWPKGGHTFDTGDWPWWKGSRLACCLFDAFSKLKHLNSEHLPMACWGFCRGGGLHMGGLDYRGLYTGWGGPPRQRWHVHHSARLPRGQKITYKIILSVRRVRKQLHLNIHCVQCRVILLLRAHQFANYFKVDQMLQLYELSWVII